MLDGYKGCLFHSETKLLSPNSATIPLSSFWHKLPEGKVKHTIYILMGDFFFLTSINCVCLPIVKRSLAYSSIKVSQSKQVTFQPCLFLIENAPQHILDAPLEIKEANIWLIELLVGTNNSLQTAIFGRKELLVQNSHCFLICVVSRP